MLYSIVIPCYNKEKYVLDTIGMVGNLFGKIAKNSFEVIVVDDGSVDESLRHLLGFSEEEKSFSLKVISTGENQGKGAAVLEGMKNSKGEYLLFLDADKPINENGLISVVEGLKDGYDLVSGDRHFRFQRLLNRKALTCIWKNMVSSLFKWPICDVQAGIKGYERGFVNYLLLHQRVKGFCFDVEQFLLLEQYKGEVLFTSVEWRDQGGTSVSFGKMIESFFCLFLLFYRFRIEGQYQKVYQRILATSKCWL